MSALKETARAAARSEVATRPDNTPAGQPEKPTLGQMIERMRPELARVLPKHLDADRMARIALTVVRKNPGLAKCTPESFFGALLTCSQLGLEPGAADEAYLVPYGQECQFIAGYKGLVKLFWQNDLAKHIDAQAVYEADDFDYAYGLAPYLVHKPAKGNRGQVVAYYACATLTNGGSAFVVLTPDEVKALRRGAVGSSGNIPDPQRWMERKTVLRQLLKMVPKSTALARALANDETVRTDLDETAIDAPAPPPAIQATVERDDDVVDPSALAQAVAGQATKNGTREGILGAAREAKEMNLLEVDVHDSEGTIRPLGEYLRLLMSQAEIDNPPPESDDDQDIAAARAAARAAVEATNA